MDTTFYVDSTTTYVRGGSGSSTAIFNWGSYSWFTFSDDGNGGIIVQDEHASGSWTDLTNVGTLQFSDGSYNVGTGVFTSGSTANTGDTSTGTTTVLDTAPTLLQPSQTGDIVGVRLQNTGTTTENSGYITFGELFKDGAVQPGDTLVARINGVNYYVQMDVKTTNSDGSVRHAILTLDAPAIAAGDTVDLMLAKGTATAPSKTAPSGSALLASGYNTTVNFTFYNSDGTTTTTSVSAADALQSALNAGTVHSWLSGSGVKEYDIQTTVDGGKLKVGFNIRAYADGTTTTDVIFDNSWMFSTGKTDLNYDVTITQGGTQVYSAKNVQQYLYSMWHHEVDSTGIVKPNVQYDVPYMMATGALNYYDTSYGVSDSGIQGSYSGLNSTNTGPLGTAGVTTYMPETGGRADIGTQPAWVVNWLFSQNSNAYQVMMANADASGSVPWHYTDESTGKPINMQTYPTFWPDSRNTGTMPANGLPDANTADPWTPDAAHQPDFNYVAYLTSGSYYQLQLLDFQANYSLFQEAPGYGSQSYLADGTPLGITTPDQQLRGIAWTLRQVAEAAYATPNSDSMSSYFVSALETNMHAFVDEYINYDWNAGYGDLKGFIYSANSPYVAPWQEFYLGTVLGEIAGMNLGKASDDAIQMLKFVDNFIAGSFINGENGYNPIWGSAYYLDMQDPTTGAPLTTWADLYTANGGTSYSMTNLGTWDTSTDGYPAYAAAALAVDITYTGSVKAIEAYGFVVAETARSLAAEGSTSSVSSDPTWAQIPKLPDGVYLTHSQMQIDTTSNDVTLTAQGGDSLLYAGSGNDTLIGGSGTCDLLFGGTGNSTLKAGTGNDYLFGGYGKNTFIDNTGNNYMKGHGTANTFMFDEANSGHDTIANFKTSTDKLQIGANLNGNGIYTAADLINTATVSNGNTVLHLSSKDDITVLGISTPSSLLNTLVIA